MTLEDGEELNHYLVQAGSLGASEEAKNSGAH